MLCEKCSNIHFQRLEECEKIKSEPNRLEPPDEHLHVGNCVFYFHHDSKHALELSATDGCHFCAMLWRHMFEKPSCFFRSELAFSRGEVIFRRGNMERWMSQEDGLREWNDVDWIYIQCEDCQATTSAGWTFEGNIMKMLSALTKWPDLSDDFYSSARREVYDEFIGYDHIRADASILLPEISPELYSQGLDGSTLSPASMVLASHWLQDCLENHGPCSDSNEDCTLPSRVINVRDPQRPFLEGGDSRSGRYVCLSYVWGTGERFVTNTSNLLAHCRALPLSQLPLTFKDAIHVTHMLGFEWLWIDALCIVQDSEEEVLNEISSMNTTFRNGTLTLFAAAGDNVHAGLCNERDPRWVKPCSLDIKTSLDGETAFGTSLFTIDRDNDNPPSLLYSRGWVLQEEVLSFRGLIFLNDQIHWRCLCSEASEANPFQEVKVETISQLGSSGYDKGRKEYREGSDGFNLLRLWVWKENPLPDRSRWQRDNHFDHWYSMIRRYSVRKLTYQSDNLKALAGLANAMTRLHRCTYLAGLWMEDLQVGLSWYRIGGKAQALKKSNAMSTDQNFIRKNSGDPQGLASWSWASTHGRAIAFRGWENNHNRIECEGLRLLSVSQQCTHAMPGSFLQHTMPQLKLEGRLKLALMFDESVGFHGSDMRSILDKIGDLRNAYCIRVLRDVDTNEIIAAIALDESLSITNSSPLHVFCLLTMVRKKYHEWQCTGLGLLPTGQFENEFTRIGLIFFTKSDWFGTLYSYPGAQTRKDASLVSVVSVV